MESANVETGVAFNQGWHLVRIGVAGLLLTASALKCWQLATEPVIGTSLLDSRWLLMATVEFELFFGNWLLANIWAKWGRAALLAWFALQTNAKPRYNWFAFQYSVVPCPSLPLFLTGLLQTLKRCWRNGEFGVQCCRFGLAQDGQASEGHGGSADAGHC